MAEQLRIAAIGEEHAVEGYRLAGALVRVAEDAEEARAAFQGLPADAGLVLLTERAAAALGDERDERMTAVLPS